MKGLLYSNVNKLIPFIDIEAENDVYRIHCRFFRPVVSAAAITSAYSYFPPMQTNTSVPPPGLPHYPPPTSFPPPGMSGQFPPPPMARK